MEQIILENICKTYYGKGFQVDALKNINLKIFKGEMIAIMGPSGSGKSTLLNILGCIDNAINGDYLLNGKNITSFTNKEMAQLRVKTFGFVLQEFALLERYTVEQNLKLPLIYSNTNKKEYSGIIDNLLKKLNIEDKKKRFPNMLSGGQRQRVAIGRALINNADIILCDEPTGALDSKTSSEIMELFTEINKSGKTIIIVTHDKTIASYCNSCIYISDGQLCTR